MELATASGHHRLAWQLTDALKGYYLRGNTAHWATAVRCALHAARTEGDSHAVSAMHNSSGVLDMVRGDYASAVDHFESALTGATSVAWPLGKCTALSNLGLLRYYTDTLPTALRHLHRADEIATAEPTCAIHATTILINLGMATLRCGNPTKALTYFTRARAAQDAAGHDRGRGVMVQLGLTEVRLHLGELTEAENLLDSVAPDIRRVSSNYETAWYLRARAELVALLGEHDHATTLLEQAMETANGHHAIAVDTQNTLADVHRLRRRFDEAESLHRDALAAADHSHYQHGRIQALLGLATIHHHRGDLTQAINDATTALDLARHTGHRPHQARVHALLAATHLRRHDHQTAADHAERARSIHRDAS